MPSRRCPTQNEINGGFGEVSSHIALFWHFYLNRSFAYISLFPILWFYSVCVCVCVCVSRAFFVLLLIIFFVVCMFFKEVQNEWHCVDGKIERN